MQPAPARGVSIKPAYRLHRDIHAMMMIYIDFRVRFPYQKPSLVRRRDIAFIDAFYAHGTKIPPGFATSAS